MRPKLALVTIAFASFPVLAGRAAVPPEPAEVLKTLKKGHPRLILTDARLAELKALAKTDTVLAKAVSDVLKQAETALKERPPVYGRSVGGAVSQLKRRVYPLGLAYRWTGDKKYARKIEQDLLAVCAFQDWTASVSFLGTAEMSHVVGVGYDWAYEALASASRRKIRAGLVANGIKPFLAACATKAWWTRTAFNWNQVCNGGVTVGALAIAEDEPKLAGAAVAHAVRSLPRAIATYDDDGMWPEGMDYWQYATQYTVLALSSLETALGTDFGLSKGKGISRAGLAVIYAAGPFNQYVNFADTLENKKRWDLPYLFWLARRYGLPIVAEVERDAMTRWPEALDVVWYVPPTKEKIAPPARDKLFRGPVEVATFRSAWNDRNALFASIKAGYNRVNHGHLDLGTFEIDALGVRWARDLGRDSYGLAGYFSDRGPGGKAWSIYRLRSVSHSVPLLDGKDQVLDAKARIVQFESGADTALAVVDLTEAYKPAATKVLRGIQLVSDRSAVLVQDEFSIPERKPVELVWAMTTDAAIQLSGKAPTVALLRIRNRVMKAQVLWPEGASFEAASAAQKPPQKANRGVSRLIVRLKSSSGTVRLAVLLVPAWPDKREVRQPVLRPLSQW